MTVNCDWWRALRRDFERLGSKDCRLIWTSTPAVGFEDPKFPSPSPSPSHWTWWRVDDDNMRTRIDALALLGAKSLGGNSEDTWYDRLLAAHRVGAENHREFGRLGMSGKGWTKDKSGEIVELQSVTLDHVVKDSIALCLLLEAESMCVEGSEPSDLIPGIESRATHKDRRAGRKRNSAERFANRAKWLDNLMAKKQISASRLAEHGCMDHRTVKKILRGEGVQDDVLRKLATAMQAAIDPNLKLSDIPPN